jgi:2-oxo-4-hydroxy-4-carboxy-5-ureidoimidazoline decarboxylase
MSENGLRNLNAASEKSAFDQLLACCGSVSWARQMVAARPFASRAALDRSAEEIWAGVGEADRLEAFRAHPKIGDLDALRSRFSHDRWAGGEQAGASGAADSVLEALAEANQRYEDRFGFIFIICASGRSADFMLAALNSRIDHSREVELVEAAAQQALITKLRLGKLLEWKT